MNVFILGLPHSGRSTVAKAIAGLLPFKYLNISNWIKDQFRAQHPDEHEQHFKEQFQYYFFSQFKLNPAMCSQYAVSSMSADADSHYIIEGVTTPLDFIKLFNHKKDIVVFLNRTDNSEYFQDHDNIGLSTMKDYCFWLASIGLLNKSHWLEYNFKLSGDDADYVKVLGSKNTVYLVKSINKVISHLESKLKESLLCKILMTF